MNSVKTIFFLAVLFTPSFFSFTVDDSQKIFYHERATLTWNDFEKVPNTPDGTNNKALSQLGMNYKFSQKGNEIIFTVKSFFIKQKSWVKDGSLNDTILKHEQTHFDICELHARELRKTIMATTFHPASVASELESLYKKEYALYKKEQAKYDSETNHSINYKQQKEWEKKITKAIFDTKEYSETVIQK